MGWFNDNLSKFINTATNAVGKIKRFGSSVGKVAIDTVKQITPKVNTIQLGEHSKLLAEMSDQAYNTSNRKESIGPYILDKAHSNNICAVYVDKDNKTCISF